MGASVEVKNATAMRVLGWLLIVVSVAEFGVGGAVYGFLTNVHLGAWWGAICCFIAGVCGAISNDRPAVVTGLVFSIFAIIVAIVGAIVDGIASAVIAAEKGCINTTNGEWWGSTEGKIDAFECATGFAPTDDFYNSHVTALPAKETENKGLEAFYNLYYNKPYSNNNNFFYNHPFWTTYYNINHYYNWYQTHSTYYWNQNHNYAVYNNNNFYYNHPYYNNNNNFYYNHPYYNHNNNFYYNHPYYNSNHGYDDLWGGQCVCSDNRVCFTYTLASGDNCGSILTTYSSLLSASTALLAILCVLSFIYSIFTCMSCGQASQTAPAPVTTAPVQVVQMTPQIGAPVYVQPVPVQYQPVQYGQPMQYGQPVQYAAVPVNYGDAGKPI